jgi:hypothetical protein
MVINSNNPNVNDSNSVEPSESVEEPPIRPYKGPEKNHVVDEKATDSLDVTGKVLSREEICKYAHTFDVGYLAQQLGVDVQYVATRSILTFTHEC